jgi:hypothetical protein
VGDGSAVAKARTNNVFCFAQPLFKKICMGAIPDENELTGPGRVIHFVDKQKIAPGMGFATAGPIAFQGMIVPFGAKRHIVGDPEKHDMLEPVHIETTGSRKSFPVSQE